MEHWTAMQWLAVSLLVMLYLITCGRVARQMGRIGRNRLLWFVLTLCLTAIPAMIVLWRARLRQMQPEADAGEVRRLRRPAGRDSGGITTCPHCHALLGPDEVPPGDAPACPRCRKPLREDGQP